MDRLGHFRAHAFKIFWVARRAAFAIGEAIAIRRAVRMGCADQNILRGDFLDASAHLVAERRGKTKEIRAHNGDASFVLFEDERAHIQLALFARYLMGRSDSAADRQQWVRRDNAHSNASAEFGGGVKCKGEKGKNQ